MTKIDFHILPTEQSNERFHYAARLVMKAQTHGHRVLIALNSEEELNAMSTQLWAVTPDSFLAHNVITEVDCTIALTFNDECGEHFDILVNLSDAIPPYFTRFNRVFEVVSQSSHVLTSSRERYRYYQDRGYDMTRHDLREKAVQ